MNRYGRRFRTEVELDKKYYGALTGKQGRTREHIERLTGATIYVPSRGQEKNVVVLASS